MCICRYHGKQSLQTALTHHLIARVQSFLGDFRAALQHEKATYSIYHKKVSDCTKVVTQVSDGNDPVLLAQSHLPFFSLQFGAEHERTKESSSCLQGLTEKAVTMQKTVLLSACVSVSCPVLTLSLHVTFSHCRFMK